MQLNNVTEHSSLQRGGFLNYTIENSDVCVSTQRILVEFGIGLEDGTLTIVFFWKIWNMLQFQAGVQSNLHPPTKGKNIWYKKCTLMEITEESMCLILQHIERHLFSRQYSHKDRKLT